MTKQSKRIVTIIGLLAFFVAVIPVYSQSEPVPIDCGLVVDAELENNTAIHYYSIDLTAGDSLEIQGDTSSFRAQIQLLEYTGRMITHQNGVNSKLFPNPILIKNTGQHILTIESLGAFGGLYTLYIDCTLSDGTIMKAGEERPTEAPVPMLGSVEFGFPGAPPQDFSVGVTLPLQAGVANPGTISEGFQGIFGYTFEASAGNTVDLSFVRQSGNLSLGLAVVGADNTVVYQTSLIGATSMSASFPIPISQTYTIGAYLINLSAPASPENTGFTIQASINQ